MFRISIKNCITAAVLLLTSICNAGSHINRGAWDWSKIDTRAAANPLQVPPGFLFGATIACEEQSSGLRADSNWRRFLPKLRSNVASDFVGPVSDNWNRCIDDIPLIKNLGLNAHSFTLSWSEIEPQEGQFNQAAIEHYRAFIKELRKNNITPMVTLYHCVHPGWFEQKGAFEKRDNELYFIRFCERMFDEYKEDVTLWCTMNEPTVTAFCGYLLGRFAPGVKDSARAGVVLRNMILAHAGVYKTLKQRPGGQEAKIGIIHQHLLFKPFNLDRRGRAKSDMEKSMTKYMSHVATLAGFEFLKTGHFKFKTNPMLDVTLNGSMPHLTSKTIKCDAPEVSKSYDFIGLNLYSDVRINLKDPFNNPAFDRGAIKTDLHYAFYPEGLYNALVDMSALNVPIYITENGIADARDDRRWMWIERYMYALNQALKAGYKVCGFFYNSLLDVMEWDDGRAAFGLYKVDPVTQERTLRNGSLALRDAIATAQVVG